MIDQPFRQILPKFAEPLIKWYERKGLHPNQITFAALGIAVLAALLTALGWYSLAILTWWLGRLLDGTDGIFARATGQTSHFGAFLDIVCDMAAYSLMIFAFAYRHPELMPLWLLILFFYILCITGAVSLGATLRELNVSTNDNRGIRLAAGLAEGGETGIAYTLFLLFPERIAITASLWIVILATTVVARGILAKKTLAQFDR
jgi:phosphatidylglycerophosphate synthase